MIVVHGGAWAIPDALAQASVEGVKAAALAGSAVLKTGGTALDAVERAVRAMEDDPVFDAGQCVFDSVQVFVQTDLKHSFFRRDIFMK